MELKAFSVRDHKIKSWSPPIFFEHPIQAKRSFEQIANDKNSYICLYSEDYEQYEIGTFDPIKGVLTSHAEPIPMGFASQYKKTA